MDDLSVLAEHADHISLRQLEGQAANEHPRRVLKRKKYINRQLMTVLEIRDILERIQIRIRGSVPLTHGSGSNSGSDSFLQ
jgi:hypothetical protein